MKIQIISDIHTEWYNTPNKILRYLAPNAPILALLGDIGYPSSGTYRDFIKRVSKLYKYVIIISGNHEYYSKTIPRDNKSSVVREYKIGQIKTMNEIDRIISDVANDYENVYYLNNNSIIIDGYKILGCTLWANVNDISKDAVECIFSDYYRIYINDNGLKKLLKVDDMMEIHKNSVKWIGDELKEDVPTIIFTHHVPTKKSEAQRSDGEESDGDSSDLEWLMTKNVKLWAFGHTHRRCDIVANNGITRLYSNPFGYPSQYGYDFKKETGAYVVEL